MQLRQWWTESAPPGWNRVKVSENLGATLVAPVAPVDTSLYESSQRTPTTLAFYFLHVYFPVVTFNVRAFHNQSLHKHYLQLFLLQN